MATFNLIPVNEISQMANAVAKSGLFGVKTPEQAMALMLVAQAEGLHPAMAARDYHVIQGKPSLKADAMMARFQAAGGSVSFDTYTEEAVKATFKHPQGGQLELEWTIEMARKAGLTNKDVWKQYPRAMLRSRVISEGIRTIFPGVAVGVYTPEEIENFDVKISKEKKVKGEQEIIKEGCSDQEKIESEMMDNFLDEISLAQNEIDFEVLATQYKNEFSPQSKTKYKQIVKDAVNERKSILKSQSTGE